MAEDRVLIFQAHDEVGYDPTARIQVMHEVTPFYLVDALIAHVYWSVLPRPAPRGSAGGLPVYSAKDLTRIVREALYVHGMKAPKTSYQGLDQTAAEHLHLWARQTVARCFPELATLMLHDWPPGLMPVAPTRSTDEHERHVDADDYYPTAGRPGF